MTTESREEAAGYKRRVEEAAAYLSARLPKADTAVVLGSGLGALAEMLESPIAIPFADIPHFPQATVKGHSGTLYAGNLHGRPLLIMGGRLHFYEGHSLSRVVFPVRLLAALGIEKLILTNAAGGINTAFAPGSLMLIRDHINLMGSNPLIGPNQEEWGPRFPDMCRVYHESLAEIALQEAKRLDIALHEGVYIAFTGPSFETPAEIRLARLLGADAVGMSTVPEAIAARHIGLKLLAISCISNAAAGISGAELNHQEVLDAGKRAGQQFTALLNAVIKRVNGVKMP
ncbi:MAG: purine-nucleoside phosphorylase [Clostridiales bacterium]|nr:purine-nucleoside phosphorylase [Clostridiales bacterium]